MQRSPNANKLFNCILEHEHEFNLCFLQCQRRSSPDLSEFLTARSILRLAYEQAFIEESDFSVQSGLHALCWRDCYEKVLEMQKKLPEGRGRTAQLGIISEGIAFYTLLLKADLPAALRYDFLVTLGRLSVLRQGHTGRDSGAYRFFKEATLLAPFRGEAYCRLGEACASEGELVSALYWLLVSLNTDGCPVSAKPQLHSVSKTLATSPSIDMPFRLHRRLAPKASASPTERITLHIVQLAAHAICNQLERHSHQTHLDHLARSKLPFPDNLEEVDWCIVKTALDIAWMVLGSDVLFQQRNGNVSTAQCCLLAKLFQVYEAFFPQIGSFLVPFACNEIYYSLYSGANQEVSRKVYPLAVERLESFLKRRVLENGDDSADEDKVDCRGFLDYLMLSSFKSYRNSSPSMLSSSVRLCLVDCFKHRSQIIVADDSGNLRIAREMSRRLKPTKSMKLLTRRLLETQVQSLEAAIAPARQVSSLPWTVLDFYCLVEELPVFERLVQARCARFTITSALLSFLDAAKTASLAKRLDSSRLVRDAIRFLYKRITAKDPSVRVEAEADVSGMPLSQEEFERIEAEAISCGEPDRFGMSIRARIRLLCEQLRAMKMICHQEGSSVQFACRSTALYSSVGSGSMLSSLASLVLEQ